MDLKALDHVNHAYTVYGLIFLLALLLFLQAPYGTLRLTYDSHDYMSASKSPDTYLHGKNPDGFSYLIRAPLFPAYLGFFENKILASWWLNVLSFVTSLFLVYRIGRSMILSTPFLFGAVLASAFSYPWLQNHFFLWTEPFFCVLIFLLVYALVQNKPIRWIVTLCLLLFFFRKAGILVGAGVAGFYLLRKEYRDFLILTSILTVAVVCWEIVMFQFARTSTVLDTVGHLTTLSRSNFADVVTGWWLPRVLPEWIRIVLCLGAIITMTIFFKGQLKAFFRKRHNQVLGTLTGVYLFLVYIILQFGSLQYMDAERFVSVFLPLVVLLCFSFLHEISEVSDKKSMIYWGVALWMIYPVARTLSHLSGF
jgi:hypothetical protein